MDYNSVLEYASNCYDFALDSVTHIDSGSNKVYKIKKENKNLYLRISTRTFSLIAAEVDWLAYLSNSINVPVPVKSNNNKILETFITKDKAYTICLFYELNGIFWDKNDKAKWNDTVFFNWGKTMGYMHCLTKEYNPSKNLSKRLTFEESIPSFDSIKFIPTVRNEMKQIIKEITSLPKNNDCYGLIHSDMHQQNFLICENEISVLDFDDSVYGWFAYDIGVALYHAIWWGIPNAHTNPNEFAISIINNFLKGYLSKNSLSEFWLRKIILFMRYRQIDALSWFATPNNYNEIVNIDLFKVQYHIKENISYIENKTFFEGCSINESHFILH